jgi:hypothetical protein
MRTLADLGFKPSTTRPSAPIDLEGYIAESEREHRGIPFDTYFPIRDPGDEPGEFSMESSGRDPSTGVSKRRLLETDALASNS